MGGKRKRSAAGGGRAKAKRAAGDGEQAKRNGRAAWVRELDRRFGWGVACLFGGRDGGGKRVRQMELAVVEPRVPRGVSAERRQQAVGEVLRRRVRPGSVARAVGVLGSVHRVRILLHLIGGAATYRGLVRATGLKAGPLYHHVNQLRLAGLVRPKERNLYEITPAGTKWLMLGAAMSRMR